VKLVILLGALIAVMVVITARRRRGQPIANVEPTFESDEKDRDDA